MTWNCCVAQCTANNKKCKTLSFHTFPKDAQLQKLWMVKIRSVKVPSKYARVCGRHFITEDFICIKQRKKLKKTAVPSQNLPKSKFDLGQEKNIREFKIVECDNYDILSEEDLKSVLNELLGETLSNDSQPQLQSTCDVAVQTLLTGRSLARCQLKSWANMNDDQKEYFTGFKPQTFSTICTMLHRYSDIANHQFVLSVEDQLLLTLIKYRTDLKFAMLARDFDITISTASDIFGKVTLQLYKVLKRVNFWSASTLDDQMLYTTILGCLEIFVEKPSTSLLQQISYSSYKDRYTFKGLLGVSEKGTFNFCSHLYGGSISDREIFKRSSLLQLIKENDCILTDKEFHINDLVEEKGAFINIPSFKKVDQLKQTDDIQARHVENRRIMVEHLISLVKQNHIFSSEIESNMWGTN